MPDQIEPHPEMMELLAGLAHEMNTPLGTIKSNSEVIDLAFRKIGGLIKELGGTAPDSELNKILLIVEDSIRTNRMACERLIGIVGNVRNFARLEDGERRKTDIHESMNSTLSLLAHMFKDRIEVVKDYGQVRQIDCYPGQLHQMFLNIILNAAQAIEGKGEIRIRTWEADNAVHIAVSDTGHGISPDVVPRIFDLGFTTKGTNVGTGLGLSIVSKAIQNHHGRIEVESQPGKGSTFTMVLPISQDLERDPNG